MHAHSAYHFYFVYHFMYNFLLYISFENGLVRIISPLDKYEKIRYWSHTDKKMYTLNVLWIKASAKCINVKMHKCKVLKINLHCLSIWSWQKMTTILTFIEVKQITVGGKGKSFFFSNTRWPQLLALFIQYFLQPLFFKITALELLL